MREHRWAARMRRVQILRMRGQLSGVSGGNTGTGGNTGNGSNGRKNRGRRRS